MHFCFLKPDLASSALGAAQYAGGKHICLRAARALAAAGHDVHLLYAAPKAELLLQAMAAGAMGSLQFSPSVEGLATWRDPALRLQHHVSLSDAAPSTHVQLSAAMAGLCAAGAPGLDPLLQRLVDQCGSLLSAWQQHQQQQQQQHQDASPNQQAWVVLDADGSQAPPRGCSSSLLQACAAAWGPSRLALLVHNVHFLPLGPQGTAPRSPQLLAAWAGLGAVLCASNFVARYVLAHGAPLGLPPQRICVAHPAAWGCFGSGPFPDLGAAMVQRLPWPPGGAAAPGSSEGQVGAGPGRSQPPAAATAGDAWRPTIGCLKLTPEKGGQLFLHLAAAMPDLGFFAVCADPGLAAAAAALALPNLALVPPGHVDELLAHMTVLLAPSLWSEAYGMVVTDALLRGVPAIVSDRGGLAEAALGCAAAVVPVRGMELAEDPATKQPGWQGRVLPQEQDLAPWVAAVRALLGSRERYGGCSSTGREAGLRLVQHQPQLLGQVVAWLASLREGC